MPHSSTTSPLPLALIGCGGMGIRHARAIFEMRARGYRPVELVAVCDADAARRAKVVALAVEMGAPPPREHARVEDLLADATVEAVDIVLPTALHHTMILAALAAGKHVLVEKPLALTVAACDLVVAAAKSTGKIVSVAENYRRIASNRAIGHLIHSGALGRPETMVVTNFAAPATEIMVGTERVAAPAWFRDRTRAGGYLVLEMGVHEVDLQRSWFGDIETVSAQVRTFGSDDPKASEDMVEASFGFASGFTSHLSFCATIPGVDLAERRLVGAEAFAESRCWHAWQDGAIRYRDGRVDALDAVVAGYLRGLDPEARQQLLPQGAWDERAPLSLWGAPLTYGVGLAIHDFARAVQTGGAPEMPAELGRANVATCHAMRESSELGERVRVADVLSGRIAGAQRLLNEAIGLA